MLMNDVRYGYKALLKSIIVFLCLLIVPLVVTIVIQEYTGKIEKMMEIWPKELIALCGITNIQSKTFSIIPFYMILIIVNMVAICRCASVASMDMMRDEESGIIKHYINQPYTKLQIYIGKMIIAIVMALIQWFEYCLMLIMMVAILCKINGLRFEDELSDVYSISVRGIVFVIFMLSISILFNTIIDRSMSLGNFLTIICTISFFVGNFYKIFEIIGYYIRRLQGNENTIAFLADLTRNFRIMYPFTLLNILNTENKPLPGGVYCIYFMISVGVLVLCGYVYSKKDFS